MTLKTASTKRSAQRWFVVVLLTMALLMLCVGFTLWAEFAPHYLPLDRIDLLDATEWSSGTPTMIARNGNRFSVWSGETKVCTSQISLCQGHSRVEVMQQLANWFVQHGWKPVQRDPVTGWNVCDNMGIVQKRSDLVFERQRGMYYKPTVCAAIETSPTASAGFTIYAATINPSPLTSWSD